MKLPGPGAIYISQTYNFRAPVYAGDTIISLVEVADLYPAKRRVKFNCFSRNQHGKDVLIGEAILMLPSREPR
jgi:3-hydroxybutyryl-CoA dehydratase